MLTTTAPDERLLDAATRLAAELQTDPTHHVTYVAADHPTLLAELGAAADWRTRAVVAHDGDGGVAGLLVPDLDAERRRVWWLGPWCRDEAVGQLLLAAADETLTSMVDSEEFAPDERNTLVGSLAAARGCVADTPSAVLSLGATRPDETAMAATTPLDDGTAPAVAALHDELFPDTHTTGAALVAADDTVVRVATLDGDVVGYVAYEVQADGAGYVDYLGVRPGDRRAGFGRLLVRSAVADLHARGCPAAHLTVRADATGAAELYRSVGFVEERRIQPWRRGFTLG